MKSLKGDDSFISLKAFYNEVVATHLNLESVLMPIVDGMTVSKVKQ
ncbi:methyltransferase [Bacillus anthracis]|nr:methyltransferase [Bacillus anthracis]